MTGCTAPNCTNSTNKGYKLYHFPRDVVRRSTWIKNVSELAARICLKKWEYSNYAALCEVHFEPCQFENMRQDGSKRLKPNAIPTIFPVNDLAKLKNRKKKVVKDLQLAPLDTVNNNSHRRFGENCNDVPLLTSADENNFEKRNRNKNVRLTEWNKNLRADDTSEYLNRTKKATESREHPCTHCKDSDSEEDLCSDAAFPIAISSKDKKLLQSNYVGKSAPDSIVIKTSSRTTDCSRTIRDDCKSSAVENDKDSAFSEMGKLSKKIFIVSSNEPSDQTNSNYNSVNNFVPDNTCSSRKIDIDELTAHSGNILSRVLSTKNSTSSQSITPKDDETHKSEWLQTLSVNKSEDLSPAYLIMDKNAEILPFNNEANVDKSNELLNLPQELVLDGITTRESRNRTASEMYKPDATEKSLLLENIRVLTATNASLLRINKQLSRQNAKLKREMVAREERFLTVFSPDQIKALGKDSTRGWNWSEKTIKSALILKNVCGLQGYEELLKQKYPLPSLRTLQRRIASGSVADVPSSQSGASLNNGEFKSSVGSASKSSYVEKNSIYVPKIAYESNLDISGNAISHKEAINSIQKMKTAFPDGSDLLKTIVATGDPTNEYHNQENTDSALKLPLPTGVDEEIAFKEKITVEHISSPLKLCSPFSELHALPHYSDLELPMEITHENEEKTAAQDNCEDISRPIGDRSFNFEKTVIEPSTAGQPRPSSCPNLLLDVEYEAVTSSDPLLGSSIHPKPSGQAANHVVPYGNCSERNQSDPFHPINDVLLASNNEDLFERLCPSTKDAFAESVSLHTRDKQLHTFTSLNPGTVSNGDSNQLVHCSQKEKHPMPCDVFHCLPSDRDDITSQLSLPDLRNYHDDEMDFQLSGTFSASQTGSLSERIESFNLQYPSDVSFGLNAPAGYQNMQQNFIIPPGSAQTNHQNAMDFCTGVDSLTSSFVLHNSGSNDFTHKATISSVTPQLMPPAMPYHTEGEQSSVHIRPSSACGFLFHSSDSEVVEHPMIAFRDTMSLSPRFSRSVSSPMRDSTSNQFMFNTLDANLVQKETDFKANTCIETNVLLTSEESNFMASEKLSFPN